MDQIGLLDAAKQQQGLTSDNQLALALDITASRVCALRKRRRKANEYETARLAEMAGIDLKKALAAVNKDSETEPAKRAYWEKISMQLATWIICGSLAVIGFAASAPSIGANLTPYKLCAFMAGYGTSASIEYRTCFAQRFRHAST